VTLGFDIQRGLPSEEGFTLSKELMQRIIDQVDILFISHYHRDHADSWVAERFLVQNKPVVTPPDLWKDSLFYGKISHPERNFLLKHEIKLPGKDRRLSFVTCPGHQGEKVTNNVSLVFTPEGMVFAHTGDQSNQEDFSWIDRIGEHYSIDVLMTNSWSVYPDFRLYRGFQPRLVLPGHENEMGHSIDHREPYWLNENRLNNPGIFPWLQMAWGERYHYIPALKK
jgi:L-ascorbate metabolism protein UlaG (beta-lactamase superfamily)